jgi:hypothetical protein
MGATARYDELTRRVAHLDAAQVLVDGAPGWSLALMPNETGENP